MIEQIVKELNIFSHLTDKEKHLFIKEAELVPVIMGQHLFEQGEVDEYIYFLVEGKVEMQAMDETSYVIYGGTEIANYPLANIQPRQYSAKAISDIRVVQVHKYILGLIPGLIQQEKACSRDILEIEELDQSDSFDWMAQILQSNLLSKIPSSNIQQAFSLFEPVDVREGDVIITQGGTGDYFYIIKQGKCRVTRKPSDKVSEIKIVELSAGESFGEEALIGNIGRNATVTMMSDGILMRLMKEDFIKLVADPTIETYSMESAQKLIDEGYLWLDVRFPKEHENYALEGSINLPINRLRTGAKKLVQDRKYIVYCNNGTRSSIAVFLLNKFNINSSYLDGGLTGQGLGPGENKVNKSEKKHQINDSKTAAIDNRANINNEKIEKIVKRVIEKGGGNENALAAALGSALSILYQRLERSIEEKLIAEKGKLEAEKKLEELLKTIQ
ncbi:MAG: hypothetical protein DRQ58_09950 [Gammaproteobacteria bacterium]|nr:MAG: hypothetical protein DRQ58_09950 [Gammaproteobacteria bacterium]